MPLGNNPIAFLGVAAIAIGIALYEYFQKQKEKERNRQQYTNSRRRQEHSSGPHNSSRFERDDSESYVISNQSKTNSNVTVRQRQLNKKVESTSNSIHKETLHKEDISSKCNVSSLEEPNHYPEILSDHPESCEISIKSKAVSDMNAQKRKLDDVTAEFITDPILAEKNDMPDAADDSSNILKCSVSSLEEPQNSSSLVKDDSSCVISDQSKTDSNIKVQKRKLGKNVNEKFTSDTFHAEKNGVLHLDNGSSSSSECCASNKEIPGTDKKYNYGVVDVDIQSDSDIQSLHSQTTENKFDSLSSFSDISILADVEEICKACEDDLITTIVKPCEHKYLCAGCAKNVFKIYKKCYTCQSNIEMIVSIDK